MEDTLYDHLYELADTVIHIEEFSEEDIHRKLVFEASKKNVDGLFAEFDKKLKLCSTPGEIIFAKEVSLNFLIASLKKLIVEYDCPDENIEAIAEAIKQQILQVTRDNWEKRNNK